MRTPVLLATLLSFVLAACPVATPPGIEPPPKPAPAPVACGEDGACPDGLVCSHLVCRPACAVDADCGPDTRCLADPGACVPACSAEVPCAGGEVCREDRCAPCDSSDECAAGEHCAAGSCLASDCTGGCRAGRTCVAGGCAGPACEPADCDEGRQCGAVGCQPGTGCALDADCRGGERCVEGDCEVAGVLGCTRDDQCVDARLCVAGRCRGEVDCAGDAHCPAGRRCVAGVCQEDAARCGWDGQCAPGLRCADGACEPGPEPSCLADVGCPFDGWCVGGACVPAGSCAADLDCPGEQRCVAGRCAGLADCAEGTADCDGDASNACEASLTVDPRHCGGCGRACVAAHGTPGCVAGRCTVAACDPDRGDCDGNPRNGCETRLRDDRDHCSRCESRCAVEGGSARCAEARCTVASCEPGLADCDESATNGCEIDVRSDPLHCGGCDLPCSIAHGQALCTGGACAVASCDAAFGDCDRRADTGCETDLAATLAHCGGCGAACAVAHGTPRCALGLCRVGACDEGFGDCDASAETGCETDVRASTDHCGLCGAACVVPHGVPACTGGRCEVAACHSGFGDCDASVQTGCETDVRASTDHCGLCGAACLVPHGVPACDQGRCEVASCHPGRADCDGQQPNGCETDLQTDRESCGACGLACAPAHASGLCLGGRCAVGTCDPGWADCDGDPATGCETDLLTSAEHCGACRDACTPANGSGLCAGGECTVGGCDADFADCDANPANGCEANLRTGVDTCGSCIRACPALNGTAVCAEGACGVGVCSEGFADCDLDPADGCETDLRESLESCGECGKACRPPNAEGRCTLGECRIATCAADRGDCDRSAATGCETDLLTSTAHCGACGGACAEGSVCVDGRCGASSSCESILAAAPSSPSGVYAVDPDGPGPQPSLSVYCDMTTDGGGWTLALAYAHAAGANAPLVPGTAPTAPASGYSHLSMAQMQTLTPQEARFYCETTAHARRIHFRTSSSAVLQFILGQTTTNSAAAWTTGFTTLVGHSAGLPAVTDTAYVGAGESRLGEFPFFSWASRHWGIRGHGGRWECDDWANNSATTLHQVWLR